MADTAVTVQTIIDNSLVRGQDLNKTNTRTADAQLLKFLNKGYEYVQQLLVRLGSEIAKTDGTVTMVASTQEYTLSGNLDDFWVMAENGVYFDGYDPLIPLSYQDKIRTSGDTTDVMPIGYYLTDAEIGLIPTPSGTSVATYTTLSCRYFARGGSLSLADNMPYKNVLNGPLGSFMDSVGVMVRNNQTAEYTELYNALEQATLEILAKREP